MKVINSMCFIAGLIVTSLASPWSVACDDIKDVTWASPLWKGFTENDHSGFYDQILNRVFAEENIAIKRKVVPWKRALLSVASGRGDVTGGITEFEGLIPSKCPIYQLTIVATCLASEKDCPKTIDSLPNYNGIWQIGTLDAMKGSIDPDALKGSEVPERSSLIQILNAKRADYIISSRVILNSSFEKLKLSNDEIASGYTVNTLDKITLFFGFSDTDRGRKIKAKFDRGWEQLSKENKLPEIYTQYKLAVPDSASCH